MVYSFDIFDTCLVRMCGTPSNMLDVLSLRVFKYPIEEWVRQEFVVARRAAEEKVWNENPYGKLSDIYQTMAFTHPALYPLDELERIETELEQTQLVPVLSMRKKINALRAKGNHIIYISDMYLPDAIIRQIMKEYGFLLHDDTLYVSCDVGKQKAGGALFRYIQEKEHLHTKDWKHFGDNKYCDYNIPKRLGLKAELVQWNYNPYPQDWKDNDYSMGMKIPSIIAGLSRALSLCNERNAQRDFTLDLVAPFYCSWVYHILDDANKKGIQRLYFCARDCYQIHKIALQMRHLFQKVNVEYCYISRQALYRKDNEAAKIAYFEKIGLATKYENVAIVDLTSSGQTLLQLNSFLTKRGFRAVKSYYYYLHKQIDNIDRKLYDVLVNKTYIERNPNCHSITSTISVLLIENFFALNKEQKTIDYAGAHPIFSDEKGEQDIYITNKLNHLEIHSTLLRQYADGFIALGLGAFAEQILTTIAIPCLCKFFYKPEKYYLKALENLRGGGNTPIIKQHNLLFLSFDHKRDYLWRQGTLAYNMPWWFLNIMKNIKRSLLCQNY